MIKFMCIQSVKWYRVCRECGKRHKVKEFKTESLTLKDTWTEE